MMFREIEIKGSLGCRPVDYPKIIEMVIIGKIQLEAVITNKFKLEDLDDAFDLLKNSSSRILQLKKV